MKKEWKIILEILVLVGGLYGLRQNNLISTEIAITIGIIITYLIFCFQNFSIRNDYAKKNGYKKVNSA